MEAESINIVQPRIKILKQEKNKKVPYSVKKEQEIFYVGQLKPFRFMFFK